MFPCCCLYRSGSIDDLYAPLDVKGSRATSQTSLSSTPVGKQIIRLDDTPHSRTVTSSVQPDQNTGGYYNKASSSIASNDSLKRIDAIESPHARRRKPVVDNQPSVDVPYSEPDYAVCSENLGKLQFSLSYNEAEATLTLKIIRAIELAAKDFSGTSDPYVKILLLPDKKTKLETSVKRKNLNPRWNEVFAFENFPIAKLVQRTLYLQVFDYDRFSRDDPIGEVIIPLSDVDLSSTQTIWRSLQPCKGHAGKLGELQVSLSYQPNLSTVSIMISQARSLRSRDLNGFSDPYVKIWLLQDGKRVEKQKTVVKEKTLNPVFNEEFQFSMPYDKIRQTSLLVQVMDWDRVGRNEVIGSLLFGTKSGPMEVKHWTEMFARPRQSVTQWHLLKDLS